MSVLNRNIVKYSPKLDLMAQAIGSFISSTSDPEVLRRTYRAIEDFCYGYSLEFRLDFLRRIGLTASEVLPLSLANDSDLESKFTEVLSRKEGECIFLLKDTSKFFQEYKKRTGKGVGIEINREFLGGEEIYFDLIHTTYRSLSTDNNLPVFLEKYIDNLKELLASNDVLNSKSKEVADYVKSKPEIIWIDTGFQYTINLFCYASVKIHSEIEVAQDVYNFTVCPWLAELFKGKYLSERNELGLGLEARSSALSD